MAVIASNISAPNSLTSDSISFKIWEGRPQVHRVEGLLFHIFLQDRNPFTHQLHEPCTAFQVCLSDRSGLYWQFSLLENFIAHFFSHNYSKLYVFVKFMV